MFETASDSLGAIQTFAPLLGGFAIVIWLAWRLFWKVDRRSQLELAVKDKKIKEQEEEISRERTKRFAAEDALAKAQARETSLETQIGELSLQVSRLREEVRLLREGK